MKKILGLFLLLVSFTSYGQFVNYVNINGRYKWIAGKFDSTFTLPSGTTPSLRVGGGTGPGALFYNTSDSIVYQYTGSQWRPLHGSDTGRIQIAYVRNTTASPMTTGQVVYINGSTGNVPTVALAVNTDDSTSAMTFGFVRGAIPVNGFGWITTFGPIDGINTNAYDEGEVIYLDSVAGQFTHDKPQAPYHMVTLGYIIKKAANGIIFVKIQNGYELEELHNVKITGPVLNKSVLIYDSVNRLWVDTTVSAAGLGLGGSGTTNYLSKWTSSTALSNSLVFDDGTNVGIGTTSPTSFAGFRTVGINNTSGSILDLMRNGTSQFQIQTTSGANALAGQTALPMSFQTNGSERMRIFATTGNISIASPTDAGYTLSVTGTFRSTLDANINGLTVGKGGGSVATNTAVGFEALLNNSTGIYSTAIGYHAARSMTSGTSVMIGYEAGRSVTTGDGQILIGYRAGKGITTGANNIIVGNGAGEYMSGTANQNVLIGNGVGQSALSSSQNVIIGHNTGNFLESGGGNVFIGRQTGVGITTGANNTIIGANVTGLSASLSNTIILADGQGNQRIVVNNLGNTVLSENLRLKLTKKIRMAYYDNDVATDGFELYLTNSPIAVIATPNVTQLQTIINGSTIMRTYATTIGINGGSNAATLDVYGTIGNGQTFRQYYLGNGITAAAPTYSFLGDLNNGWYSPSADVQGWSVGGSDAMRLFSNGNFAIGTTTDAGYKLDVNGTARVQSAMGINAAPSTSTAQLYVSPSVYNKPGILIKDLVGGYVNAFQIQNFSNETIFDIGIANGQTAIGTTHNSNAYLTINQKTYGPIGLVIKPNASGFIHDLMQIQDNTGSVLSGFSQTGRLYIGNTSAETSAALSVKSTTLGFLPPRMTNAQMVAIATPAAGLVVYDTTNNKLNVYDGTNWVAVH